MLPLIIVNPASGRGRTQKQLPALKHELAERRLDAEVRVSRSPADVSDWADEAAEAGRTVIAFGGDGLVNMMINSVAGRIPLGLIPGGVGNDFASTVGIPTELGPALDVIRAGHVRKIDLGRATAGDTSRLYTCIASAGFDSEANERANTITWMSGTPLYTYSAMATLVGWRSAEFRIETDDDSLDLGAWLVAVGNGRRYGGGMHICPDADLDDGLLDVTILGDLSKLEFLCSFPKVFSGKHVGHPKVRTLRAREVRLAADRHFDCYIDGERFAPLPVQLEAVPGAAEILAPEPN